MHSSDGPDIIRPEGISSTNYPSVARQARRSWPEGARTPAVGPELAQAPLILDADRSALLEHLAESASERHIGELEGRYFTANV
jgi:hypothetical protein